MIRKITINNFKSIKESKLELEDINLLCGTNASGKSTLIHALLTLAQNNKNSKGDRAVFNGDLVRLGEFKDVKNSAKSMTEGICVKGEYNTGEKFILDIENKFESTTAESVSTVSEITNLDYFSFEDNLYYISSNRIGDVELHDTTSNFKYGSDGQYTLNYLMKNSRRAVSSKQDNNVSGETTLLNEVNFWLNHIVGAKLEIKNIEDTSKLIVTYQNNGGKAYVRSSNTGTGISYLISIIIMCLGIVTETRENNTIKPLIIIENPEIHLHPKAQSNVMEFLLYISNFVQLIIETQSDHIFNRFRVEVKEKRNTDFSGRIYFAEYNNEMTIFEEVKLNEKGAVINNKKGLFDQFDSDLLRLLV